MRLPALEAQNHYMYSTFNTLPLITECKHRGHIAGCNLTQSRMLDRSFFIFYYNYNE